MRYAIGIDPGMDGAVAVVSEQGFVGVYDTPVLTVEKPKDRKSKSRTMHVYDKAGMVEVLRLAIPATAIPACSGATFPVAPDTVLLVLEKVTPMPDQGVTSMFTFGRGLGIWEGIVAALAVSLLMPAPQTWKKAIMRDGPKTKEAAVVLAQQLYPAAGRYLRGPNGGLKIDRAEAILLARYGLIFDSLQPASSPKKSRAKNVEPTDDQQADDPGSDLPPT